MGWDNFHQAKLLKAPSNLTLLCIKNMYVPVSVSCIGFSFENVEIVNIYI